MKEFNKAYLEILNSRVFYESVLHKDIVLKAEKQDFYKNLVKFYKDGMTTALFSTNLIWL